MFEHILAQVQKGKQAAKETKRREKTRVKNDNLSQGADTQSERPKSATSESNAIAPSSVDRGWKVIQCGNRRLRVKRKNEQK